MREDIFIEKCVMDHLRINYRTEHVKPVRRMINTLNDEWCDFELKIASKK